MYLINVQRFHRHQSIFKEGDPIDNIYLIHKGEVQIMMDVYQPPIKNKLGIKVNQPNKSINLEISGFNSCIGHDDILLGKQYRTYSAIALNDRT